MAPKAGGGFVCSFLNKGFGTIDLNEDGTLTETVFKINPNVHGENFVVFNDAKCSPEGRFFAGQKDDMLCLSEQGLKDHLPFVGQYNEEGSEALVPLFYRLDSVRPLKEDPEAAVPMEAVGRLLCCNGPTWSPDASRFYHADSP